MNPEAILVEFTSIVKPMVEAIEESPPVTQGHRYETRRGPHRPPRARAQNRSRGPDPRGRKPDWRHCRPRSLIMKRYHGISRPRDAAGHPLNNGQILAALGLRPGHRLPDNPAQRSH